MANKRIDLTLFDDALKTMINASAKIFPMAYSDISANNNPSSYEYTRCIDAGSHHNEIYFWETSSWVLVGADDKTIDYTKDIANIPITFTPSQHSHTKSDVTDFTHSHSESDVTGLVTALAGKSSTGHAHNESDISGLVTDLAGKSATGHTHNESDITNLIADLASKSDSTHNHDGRYYTQSQTVTQLSGKSDTTHNHDSAYAAKSVESTVTSHASRLDIDEANIANNASDIITIQNNMLNGDVHSNITVLNQITQILLDAWNSAVTHISDAVKHITSAERTTWNAKSNFSGVYSDLTGKPSIPTVVSSLTNDSGYQTAAQVTSAISGKADKSYVDAQDVGKVDSSTFIGHTGNTTVHVLQADKDTWNAKQAALSGDVAGHYHTSDRYTHPANHPPSIITQDASNRFTTDSEKTCWNAKAPTTAVTTSVNGLMIASDKSKLDGVAAGATNYTHPANHPPSIITQDASNRFTTDAEKTAWNAKANVSQIPTAVSQLTNDSTTQITITNVMPTYGLWIHD